MSLKMAINKCTLFDKKYDREQMPKIFFLDVVNLENDYYTLYISSVKSVKRSPGNVTSGEKTVFRSRAHF